MSADHPISRTGRYHVKVTKPCLEMGLGSNLALVFYTKRENLSAGAEGKKTVILINISELIMKENEIEHT